MKYFNNPQTLEELKKEYAKLVFKYHPDRGGSNEEMARIINEYKQLREQLTNQQETYNNKNNKRPETETDEQDELFREIIIKIVHLPLDIEICGTWVWISGNTWKYREYIKNLGFRWTKYKKKWYWFPDIKKTKKKKKTNTDMNWIRKRYGSKILKTQEPKQLDD